MALYHPGSGTTDQRVIWPAGVRYMTMPFSVCLRFKCATPPGAGAYNVAAMVGNTDTSTGAWHVSGYNAQNKIGISVRNSSNSGNWRVESGTGTPWDGAWHFAAFVVQTGTNASRVFLDDVGVAVGTISNIYNPPNSFYTLLGYSSVGNALGFGGGSVADVRVYSGALSDASVAMIRDGKMRDGITANLQFSPAIADGCVGIGSLSGKVVYDHSASRSHTTCGTNAEAILDPYNPWPVGGE